MQTPRWQRVFARYPGKVFPLSLNSYDEMPASWRYYMQARLSGLRMEDPLAWWREAVQVLYPGRCTRSTDSCLRYVCVCWPPIVIVQRNSPLPEIARQLSGQRYLLFVGDADEILSTGALAELSSNRIRWYHQFNSAEWHPGVVYFEITTLVRCMYVSSMLCSKAGV